MRCRAALIALMLSASIFDCLLSPSLKAGEPAVYSAAAEQTVPAEPTVIDVALSGSGVLNGQVLGPDGKPLAAAAVFIFRGTAPIATCQTNQAGGFTLAGLPGGLYEIRCQQSQVACRLWAPQTAPPSARSAVLLTTGGTVVRGQTAFFSRRGSWLRGPAPWIIGGVVAVAVPVALTIHHSESSS